jgi:hypothetical protein
MAAIRFEQGQPSAAAICEVMNLFEVGAARVVVDGDAASFREVRDVLMGAWILAAQRADGAPMSAKPVAHWVNKALFALCLTFIVSLVLTMVRLNVRGN